MLIQTRIIEIQKDAVVMRLSAIDLSLVAQLSVPFLKNTGVPLNHWMWTEIRWQNGDKQIIDIPFNQAIRLWTSVHEKKIMNHVAESFN